VSISGFRKIGHGYNGENGWHWEGLPARGIIERELALSCFLNAERHVFSLEVDNLLLRKPIVHD
jgi:hypothetical protein